MKDLLDGAQGFANSTSPPLKAECEGAIDQTIDRLRELGRRWSTVLSHGALMQSLGSFLSTSVGQMIIEVEDLGDIGEEESRQLKHLCDRMAAVRDVFTQPSTALGQDARDMTFVYCPNWLKFQYLSEMLESSLADITWMWTEGELALEFAAEEVVGLIEASFADSEHRRRAVADIRRRGGR